MAGQISFHLRCDTRTSKVGTQGRCSGAKAIYLDRSTESVKVSSLGTRVEPDECIASRGSYVFVQKGKRAEEK